MIGLRFVPKREQLSAPTLVEWREMAMDTEPSKTVAPPLKETPPQVERLAYSIAESAALLGVHYFSVYRLIQRRKLRACHVLSGKLLIPRSELLKLLKED
jgi:excisionase family DNA binding protein